MLYKYLKREHLKAFFQFGSLKIGTLYEYRNEEELGKVIGDGEEGTYVTELLSPNGREIDLSGSSAEADYFRQHVLRPDQWNSKVKVVMEAGASLITNTNSPNYYIYCVSSHFDELVMHQFGCDSCIEIVHPEKFFKAISKVIRHKGGFEGVHRIAYGPKKTDHLNPHGVHPALLKDSEYSYQAEMRAIWKPKKEPQAALFVKVPRAIRYCREYKT